LPSASPRDALAEAVMLLVSAGSILAVALAFAADLAGRL
jgi:hypothetical protein